MEKKILLLFFLFMFFSASCQAVSLVKHEIIVSLDEMGEAAFEEKYFLNLTPVEKPKFIEDVEENGKSLIKWRNDYDFIFPRFGSTDDLESINFTFDEEALMLELVYSLKTEVVQKVEETARSIKYSIPSSFFEKFIKGTTIEIPDNTQIIIEIPRNAFVEREEITKEVQIQDSKFFLQGFRGSNIFLFYNINKPIAPPLDTQQLIEQALSNPLNQVVLAVIIVLLALAYFWRGGVVDKIEGFIVRHSQIGEKEEEIEIE